MKKLNVKKLNQFYMSGNNAENLKSLVKQAVEDFVGGTPSVHSILVLQDLGLLMESN